MSIINTNIKDAKVGRDKRVYTSVLEAVGWTPLIRLSRITAGIETEIWAKVESFNPGGSVKDRIGIAMIEEAERRGRLGPGGTIVEPTSGNTGVGLALVAALKGYRMIFTIPDKMSEEKINLLRAYGAEVIVCPTAVAPDDPESYYSVARRIAEETPGAFMPNQYANPKNPEAHYRTTGPEIWEQTEGKLDYFVAGLGTGGTISGVGRFLKERDPSIKVIGVDPEGSILKQYFETGELGEAHTYDVEGIGEDIIPETVHFQYIDEIRKVGDRESFIAARRLAREEGLFVGGSAGSAVHIALEIGREAGRGKRIVALLPDTGRHYLRKFHSDEWMKEHSHE